MYWFHSREVNIYVVSSCLLATDWVLFNILQSHKPYGFPDGFSIDANILFVEAIFIWTNTLTSQSTSHNYSALEAVGKRAV